MQQSKRCGQELRATAPTDAPPLQNAKSEDESSGDEFYVAGQDGKEMAAVLGDDHGDGGGAAGGEPSLHPTMKPA